MRKLSDSEVAIVDGGSAPQTMDVGCFAANVYLGISPFFGPAAVVSAVFGVVIACHEVGFRS
ncbi:MAG: hypothetical protein Q7L19_16015 [Pseudohongiella sp.]|nr:hypothetical protein [Pseudohongiella sp.]